MLRSCPITESAVIHSESPGTVRLGLSIYFTGLSLLWAIHKDRGAAQEETELSLTTPYANIYFYPKVERECSGKVNQIEVICDKNNKQIKAEYSAEGSLMHLCMKTRKKKKKRPRVLQEAHPCTRSFQAHT